jgi:hypothetical protein
MRGFGQPTFTWKINGVVLPGTIGTINTTASVTTRTPAKPLQTTVTAMTVSIAYSITSDLLSSKVAFTLDAVIGAVDLTVELDVRERFASSDVTTATGLGPSTTKRWSSSPSTTTTSSGAGTLRRAPEEA